MRSLLTEIDRKMCCTPALGAEPSVEVSQHSFDRFCLVLNFMYSFHRTGKARFVAIDSSADRLGTELGILITPTDTRRNKLIGSLSKSA